MRKSIFQISVNNSLSGYTVTETTHQGKSHIIVPVTIIVEGVLNGSHGPILHLAEEFGKYPNTWDGIPVVIDHPQINGLYVSANSPEIVDNGAVGRIYNSHLDNNALKAEAWLEVDKLTKVSPDVFSAIGLKQNIEVSMGAYSDAENTEGEYNGKQYNAIARNHRPDHLALLPGGVGACSLIDGCGIRVNNKKKGEKNEMIDVNQDQFKQYNDLRYTIRGIIDNSTNGLKEQLDKLRNLIYSLDVPSGPDGNGGVWHYLEEAYDTYLIYEQNSREGEKCFKQSYSFDAQTGEPILVGDPVEVEEVVTYVPIITNNSNSLIRTKPSKKQSMECTPCVKKRVDALIANATAKFTEDDRAMLETLSESILDRMIPVQTPTAPAIEALSADEKAALNYGKKLLKEKRDGMIANIQSNTPEGLWSVEVLSAMSEEMLEKIDQSISKKEEPANYSGNGAISGGTLAANAAKITPMFPAGIEVK